MDNITTRVQNAELLSDFCKHFSTDTFCLNSVKLQKKQKGCGI